MLERSVTSCLLLHIVLRSCAISARACLIEVVRILCRLTWEAIRRNAHLTFQIRPIVHALLGLCTTNESNLRVQWVDHRLTIITPSNLHVTCNNPMVYTNGDSHVTLQMNVLMVRLNRLHLPETIWFRMLAASMPKKITIGRAAWYVQLSKVARKTIQFKLCGDVAPWVGVAPVGAYVRWSDSTLELRTIPAIG